MPFENVLISVRVGTNYPEKIKKGGVIFVPQNDDSAIFDCVSQEWDEDGFDYAVELRCYHEPAFYNVGAIAFEVFKVVECIANEKGDELWNLELP